MARPLPDLRSIKRLLIIRLSAIGDVIHALPLASALKEAHPHLEISWLVEEIPADVVAGSPAVDRVIVIPRSRWKRGRGWSPRIWGEYLEFLRRLRTYRFEVTIDLQGYAKSAVYALATGARCRLGWWRMRDGSGLASRSLPRRPESVHRVDQFLDVARNLGVVDPLVRFPIDIPENAETRVKRLLCAAGIDPARPYAVINQAAGNTPRRWGIANFAELTVELAAQFGLPTVLVGTKSEAPDCNEVAGIATRELRRRGICSVCPPVSLAGATGLKELAALLRSCALHVCGDTGSTHLAAALGVPVVAIYGSTDPAHAGPWGQASHVLARKDLCLPACTIRACTFAPPEAQADGGPRNALGDGLVQPTARCLQAIPLSAAVDLARQILERERDIVALAGPVHVSSDANT